jgi:hypothetical protein
MVGKKEVPKEKYQFGGIKYSKIVRNYYDRLSKIVREPKE